MIKQIFAASIALLGLNAAAVAQPAPAETPAAQTTAAPTCALPSVTDTVEMKPVSGNDLVTVPVEINGKPKQFLLAVSTNASEVSQATVDELHLTEGLKRTETFQSGPATQSDGSANRNANVGATVQATLVDVKGANPDDGRAHVNIPSFTLGNATGHNLLFAVATDREIGKSAPYDGLMTGSFFKSYDVELDFTSMKLNYLTPNTCTDPHQVVFWPHKEVAVIPMNMVNGKIQVQVNVNGQLITAALDTSSRQSVMRRDIAENTLNLKANTPQMPPAGDLRDGEDMQIYTATFPQITFAGGVTAYNVPALIQTNGMTHQHKETELYSRAQFKNAPRIPALTLGMDVLRQLHLYIVYGQGNIYMTSAG
jgi:Aspartyl protease